MIPPLIYTQVVEVQAIRLATHVLDLNSILDVAIEKLGLLVQLRVVQGRDHGNCIVVYHQVVHLSSCTWKYHVNCHERVYALHHAPTVHKLIHHGVHHA